MAIIICPDCLHKISDRAPSCPHCDKSAEDASENSVPTKSETEAPPGVITSTEAASTKNCPYCAEEIRSDAIKCKHCHESIISTEWRSFTETYARMDPANQEQSLRTMTPDQRAMFERIWRGRDQKLAAKYIATKPEARAARTADSRQVIGIVGSILLSIGVFTPIIKIPIVGTMNYFRNGQGDGVIILLLAIASFILTFTRRFRGLWYTGLAAAGILLFTFANFQITWSEARQKLDQELSDNPFRGLADLAVQSVELQWGWAVLATGAALVIIAAARRGSEQGVNAQMKLDPEPRGAPNDPSSARRGHGSASSLRRHDRRNDQPLYSTQAAQVARPSVRLSDLGDKMSALARGTLAKAIILSKRTLHSRRVRLITLGVAGGLVLTVIAIAIRFLEGYGWEKHSRPVDESQKSIATEDIDAISIQNNSQQRASGDKATQNQEGTSTRADDEGRSSNITDIVFSKMLAHCTEKYDSDYDMREYCMRQQYGGFQETQRPNDIPEATYQQMLTHCTAKYNGDYDRRGYCMRQQYDGLQETQRPNGISEAAYQQMLTHCSGKYSGDYDRRGYCMRQQYDGLQETERPDDIPETAYQKMHAHCSAKYSGDYDRRGYCMRQQYDGFRKLLRGP